MGAVVITEEKTEAELEARANGALLAAMPWLDVGDVKHQLTFSFKLGHEAVTVDGNKSSRRQGRLDVLVTRGEHRLAILELKRPGKALTDDDVEQGLSYARVLHPRPPLVIVSNGKDTRTYATHSGDPIDASPGEQALSDLVTAALKIADSAVADAIATLMGPRSDVWMAAVRSATAVTLEELTGDWDDAAPVLTRGFHIPRKAAAAVAAALRGARRVVALEGAPLAGKTHVLRQLATETRDDDDLAVLLLEASGTAATGIAEEVARLLGAAVGWRVTAAEARRWMETLGAGAGPTLVVAVDGLGLEQDAIRHELQALTAKAVGDRLKFVVEADNSVVDRLWLGESRRKPTPFARRGVRVEVGPLDDDEFDRAMEALASVDATLMKGADKADEYRRPWILRSMAAGVATSPERAEDMVAILPPLLSLDLISHARERFDDEELVEQAAAFARCVVDDLKRGDRGAELTLRSMHTFLVRRSMLREQVDGRELASMEGSGLVGRTSDSENRPLVSGRIPELVASELAQLIAHGLNKRLDGDDGGEKAAKWLIESTSALPFGDLIGAQALLDLSQLRFGLSLPFLNALLKHRPTVQRMRPGSRSVAWLPDIGRLDLFTRADGTVVIKKPEWPKGVEVPPEDGPQTYADMDAWLILSHLAAVPIGAVSPGDGEKILGIVNPAILALVGTCPFPLRRFADDPERTGMHTHDASDGSSLACSADGIIEPVTFSLLRFLEWQRFKADDWLDEAAEAGNAAFLNRLSTALGQLASMNPTGDAAGWARGRLDAVIAPALRKALASPSVSIPGA